MAVSDIRVYAGATDGWVSLRGADGAPGPTVVSADAGNLCRLGTDNRILVAQADLDARFVNVTGDTMTGNLRVNGTAGTTVYAANTSSGTGGNAFVLDMTGATATSSVGLYLLGGPPASASNFAIYSSNPASSSLDGKLGLKWSNPTRQLEVGGDAIIRGPLEVTGNITSSGTAHNFQPNSILASAISGLPVAASTAPLDPSVVAATGNLTTYARADHQHKLPTYAALGPLPVAVIGQAGAVKVGAGINLAVDGTISVATSSLKADDLTDVTVTTPAAGQVLRWNGTAFVNAALSYADLTGAPAAPVASTVAGTALAATAAVGVSTAYARADHVHPLPTAAQVGAITQADADTRYVNITGDTVTGDLILNGKVGIGVTPTSGFHVKTATIQLDGATSTNTIVANAPSGFGGIGVIDSASIVTANATAAAGSYTAVFARTRGTDLNPAIPRVGDFAFRSEGPAPSQLGGALSVAGNITSTGTAHSFANASIPYAAVASPGPICNFYQASRTITAADVGRMIVNNSATSTPVVFTLPDDTVLPVGVKLEIYDASTLSSTTIAVNAGVSMAWNTGLSGGTAGGLNTGVGPRDINMASPVSRITALKVAANFWMLFSSN